MKRNFLIPAIKPLNIIEAGITLLKVRLILRANPAKKLSFLFGPVFQRYWIDQEDNDGRFINDYLRMDWIQRHCMNQKHTQGCSFR